MSRNGIEVWVMVSHHQSRNTTIGAGHGRASGEGLGALAGVAHGLVQLPRRATFPVDFATDGDFDDALLRAYAHLLRDLDLFEQPPYNLLLSKSWLLVVKRRSRDGAGVDVNALGYAGCLLARDESSFARVAAAPRAALAAAAVPSTGY